MATRTSPAGEQDAQIVGERAVEPADADGPPALDEMGAVPVAVLVEAALGLVRAAVDLDDQAGLRVDAVGLDATAAQLARDVALRPGEAVGIEEGVELGLPDGPLAPAPDPEDGAERRGARPAGIPLEQLGDSHRAAQLPVLGL